MTYLNKMAVSSEPVTIKGIDRQRFTTMPDEDEAPESDSAKGIRFCCKGTGPESCGQVLIHPPTSVVTRIETR